MLPSTKRPKEVEEERAARLAEQQRLLEQQRRDALKVRISKVDIFRGTLAEWYKNLKPKEKRRLTGKRLKKQALAVCHKYSMEYENLPDDWVHVLQTKYKMKLYRTSKKRAPAQKPVAEPIVRHNPREQRQVKQAVPFQYDPSNFLKTPDRSTSDDNTVVNAFDMQVPVCGPNVNKKKWVDYTNDPPPPAWTKKYAEGIVLPRVLTIYSREDVNMAFYDYNPKLQDSEGNEVKLTPQPRINTDYFDPLHDTNFDRPKFRKRQTFGTKKFHGKPKYPIVYED